jgi:hypothetical protein
MTREERGEWLSKIATGMTGIPGDLIDRIWKATNGFGDAHPMVRWLFISLAASVMIFVMFLPLLALRLLLPDIYHLMMQFVRWPLRLAIRPIRQAWHRLSVRPILVSVANSASHPKNF